MSQQVLCVLLYLCGGRHDRLRRHLRGKRRSYKPIAMICMRQDVTRLV